MLDRVSTVAEIYHADRWRPADDGARTLHDFVPEPMRPTHLYLLRRTPHGSAPNEYVEHYVSADRFPRYHLTAIISSYGSSREAREALLGSLSRLMAVRLPAAIEYGIDVGEVAFVGHDDPSLMVMYVRGNIKVEVNSVGPEPYPVTDIARSIDEQIRVRQQRPDESRRLHDAGTI